MNKLLNLWLAQATAFASMVTIFSILLLGFAGHSVLLILLFYAGAWILKLPEFVCHLVYAQYSNGQPHTQSEKELISFRFVLAIDILVCLCCGLLVWLVKKDIQIATLIFLLLVLSDLIGLILMPRKFIDY